jgi:hypothetical protein
VGEGADEQTKRGGSTSAKVGTPTRIFAPTTSPPTTMSCRPITPRPPSSFRPRAGTIQLDREIAYGLVATDAGLERNRMCTYISMTT